MSHILKYDQFKTGYTSVLSIRPEINENLLYLDNRYNDVNEGFIRELPDYIIDGAVAFWDSMTKNEEGDWSFRNIAHTVADIGGVVGDFFLVFGIPAGSIIDIAHGIVYFIEAGLTDDEEKKNSCMLLGSLTMLFAIPFLNPIQLFFKGISKGFGGLWKWVKEWSGSTDPKVVETAQQQIEKTLSKDRKLDQFMQTVTDNLDEVETFFAKEFNAPQTKGWWKKLMDWFDDNPARKWMKDGLYNLVQKVKTWFQNNIIEPFKNYKKYKGEKGIKGSVARTRVRGRNVKYWTIRITGKTIHRLNPISLVRYFGAVSAAIRGFPIGRKIKIFDTMMENLSKAQKDAGFIFELKSRTGKLMKSNLETKVLVNKNKVRIMDLGTGGNKAYAILSGKTTDPVEIAKLETYWAKQWDDLIAPRSGEFNRNVINSTNKKKWIDLQVASSRIKEIDKSEFVEKWYKTYENKIKASTATTTKSVLALVKFYSNVFGHNTDQPQDGDPTTNTDIDVQGGDARIVDDETTLAEAQGEITISEEEAIEIRDELSANDPVFDNFTPSYDGLDSEEREDLARSATETSVDIDMMPPTIDINYVVWKILSDKYRLDMPENPVNKPFTNELKRYQRDESLSKISGELDEETLDALYNETDKPTFRTFLEAFIEVYFEEEEEDEEDGEYKEIPEEDSRADKEKKPKRGEKIKKFGKWLAGTLEEE